VLAPQVASRVCSDVLAKWSAALQVSSASLMASIPDYSPYVCEVFDPDTVKEAILSRSWSDFASHWGALSRQLSLVTGACEQVGQELSTLHQTAFESCSAALKNGKTFITVVSTLQLIIVSLPAAPKASRQKLISQHMAKVSEKGGTLPANLSDYLDQELRRAQGKR